MVIREIRTMIFDTVKGPAAVAGSSAGLCLVILPGFSRRELRSELRRRLPDSVESDRGLKAAAAAVALYFKGGRLPKKSPRLDLDGVGEFRRAVYGALAQVGAGETVTYSELAQRIGRPGAHRSVGTALSRNPIPLFVPCHRVLRADGGLGGFTAKGGLELKAFMLALEEVRK